MKSGKKQIKGPINESKVVRNPRQLPLLHVKGNHRQVGQQIGEAARTQIEHNLENTRLLLEGAHDSLQLSWENAQNQTRKYLPFIQERYPKYVEELQGIAEGANVPFEHINLLNAIEGVMVDALHLTKCTSMAVAQERTANDCVLVAHNEDWVPEDEYDAYLVHVELDDEPAFLALSYGGFLPNIGFNAAGIAQCCDTVYPSDSRIGIPRIVVSRAVLGARTPGEAFRHILVPHRAAGYNHLIAHESGELYSIEASSRSFAVLYAEDGILVHTNHYLDPRMLAVENEPDELISTRVRYFRAKHLMEQTELHTVSSLQAIQCDHVNRPDSICNHSSDGDALDREKTIAAILIDLTNRQLHAAWGSPCENAYHTYQLDA